MGIHSQQRRFPRLFAGTIGCLLIVAITIVFMVVFFLIAGLFIYAY